MSKTNATPTKRGRPPKQASPPEPVQPKDGILQFIKTYWATLFGISALSFLIGMHFAGYMAQTSPPGKEAEIVEQETPPKITNNKQSQDQDEDKDEDKKENDTSEYYLPD